MQKGSGSGKRIAFGKSDIQFWEKQHNNPPKERATEEEGAATADSIRDYRRAHDRSCFRGYAPSIADRPIQPHSTGTRVAAASGSTAVID